MHTPNDVADALLAGLIADAERGLQRVLMDLIREMGRLRRMGRGGGTGKSSGVGHNLLRWPHAVRHDHAHKEGGSRMRRRGPSPDRQYRPFNFDRDPLAVK